MQEKPTQELIVNDLQGSEWRFKHVYQGNSSSLMDGTGKLHIGIRRLSNQCCSIGSSTFSRQSMEGSSRFIMSLSKYFEGGNHWSGFGMISKMQHGGDDSHVRR
ncbi:hypothetical protein RND71_025773 [Anisodus tanguticus]|uniref:Uncharacterized protein n=1 Tax=Anisodus tanguticus TaxID=243964 RepID=A0AAE1RJK3_9SOLA|nr:hypothetical protein RND71_025773 [Anisodus tanguticus]